MCQEGALGVLAFGITGYVDALLEWQAAGVESFRERGLTGADDAGKDDVGGGDDPVGVQNIQGANTKLAPEYMS